MKSLVNTLINLDWQFIVSLIFFILLLSSLVIATLTVDLSLASATSGLAARPKPTGYSWGG
jgi:hypothetical protein